MWFATFSTASSTRQVGSSSVRCCVRNADATVIPVTNLPPLGFSSPASVRINVVLPAPLTPTIPIRSPGPTFHVRFSISSLSPIFTCIWCASYTVFPKRLRANFRSSVLSRGAGSAEISSLAASTRNFGFVVRAGAPRRNHANSLRIRALRRPSSTDA